MNHISLQLVAILLLAVLLFLGKRRLSRLGFRNDDLSQLARELKRHMPVYSAETTQGREAEFIRDRLRKRVPPVLVLLATLMFGALVWWLSR